MAILENNKDIFKFLIDDFLEILLQQQKYK